MLRSIPRRLREILTDPDAHEGVVARLFPPSHSDPKLEEENRRLLGETLMDMRRDALDRFEALVARFDEKQEEPVTVSSAEVELLLHVVNDLRLVLGTELGIEDNGWLERGPPSLERTEEFLELVILSTLQEEILAALMEGGD